MSPWYPLCFSETSTFMILYKIKGIHLSGCHLKSVHPLVTLLWHVCPSCSSNSSSRIYQTCFPWFEASFHDSPERPQVGVVWLQLSSRWWQPRTCSIDEGSLAQEMGRGRWRVDALSGCMFLDTRLFYGLRVWGASLFPSRIFHPHSAWAIMDLGFQMARVTRRGRRNGGWNGLSEQA